MTNILLIVIGTIICTLGIKALWNQLSNTTKTKLLSGLLPTLGAIIFASVLVWAIFLAPTNLYGGM